MPSSEGKRDTPTTELQKKAADELLLQKASGGNLNYKKALLSAGYALATARRPKDVIEAPGFRKYMEQYNLNENRVAALLSEEIEARGAGERLDIIKFLAQLLGMTEAKISMQIQQSDQGVDMLRKIIEADATRPEQDIPGV